MGRNDRNYLLARAIQFFLPGIPQVYYVGLLAGHNDMELLAKSGVGRDINRQHFSPAQIDAALQRPVVRQLFELIRLRNEHPAFAGEFFCGNQDANVLSLTWRNDVEFAHLQINFVTRSAQLIFSAAEGGSREFKLDPG
jgi:sucrose phosphorylase